MLKSEIVQTNLTILLDHALNSNHCYFLRSTQSPKYKAWKGKMLKSEIIWTSLTLSPQSNYGYNPSDSQGPMHLQTMKPPKSL